MQPLLVLEFWAKSVENKVSTHLHIAFYKKQAASKGS